MVGSWYVTLHFMLDYVTVFVMLTLLKLLRSIEVFYRNYSRVEIRERESQVKLSLLPCMYEVIRTKLTSLLYI